MSADVLLLSLGTDMSDAELKDAIQQILPICEKRARGFCLSVGGYDADPRELWEIPEAIDLFKRCVNLGVIAGLEVSTTSPDLVRSEVYGTRTLPGFGALEVWMCAMQKLPKDAEISKEIMDEFFEALHVANRAADEVRKEPPQQLLKPRVFVADYQAADGTIVRNVEGENLETAINRASQRLPYGSVRHQTPKRLYRDKWV